MQTKDATFTALPRFIVPADGITAGKPSKWEVQISYNHSRFPGCYGYFEHDIHGEGGGLWFERQGDKWALTDYDGITSLPMSIVHTLRNAGFVVSADFE